MAELFIIFDQSSLNEEAEDREIDLTLLQSSPALALLDELGLAEPDAFMRAPTLDDSAFGDGEDDEPVEFDEASEDWHEAAEGLDWARGFAEGLKAGAGPMSPEMRDGMRAILGELIVLLKLADEAEARFHFSADE